MSYMQPELHKLSCGLYRCPYLVAVDRMPELAVAWDEFKGELPDYRYVVDVKIHMLMPGQWPCIPNWHYDMIPRDESGEQDFSRLEKPLPKLYAWVSGHPEMEFDLKSAVHPVNVNPIGLNGIVFQHTWTEFTQLDLHRGRQSKHHVWRAFIRCCPDTVLEPAPPEKWDRRHSQVYLDAENFTW